MAPPAFKDISKAVTSIFKDDYGSDRKLTVKSKAGGLGFKVENSIVEGGAVAGLIEAKYAHSSGVSLDKLKLNAKGALSLETTVADVGTPGLDVYYKGDLDFSGTTGVSYKDAAVNASVEVDVPALAAVTANATVAVDAAAAGLSLKYGLAAGKGAGLADYALAAGYREKAWFASLAAEKKLSVFKLGAFWNACPPADVGAQVTYTPATGATLVDVGTVYNCNPTTTVRVKASSEGAVAAAVAQKCGKGMTLTAASEVSVSDLSKVKYGASITLG
mmetsp:Transcript_35883/g.56299  ORF Transcript_35883/g.56299 Transcript_35883/m.56299 type:complete len:275 (-) Transcript_35883:391-1215(-)|eukprot:CAMPEP_0194711640 /NCGR_PEP_ID=MMETSP0296-20130528/3925_1 /TAXON_ID=39354 /ORGANISM="Heterosigma akashiwo, Strain CCMP2393" /LENGTH=274 /DNA_ID=CAMNT_0039609771 /DNA_START=107 /DNA_END=931 /DNA_ORIENTATION=+